jgi:hypothetical protein
VNAERLASMAFLTQNPLRLDPEPSAYLTDGVRLFRVITGFSYPPETSRATLEDCATLGVSSYSPDELWGMGLRLVRGPKTDLETSPNRATEKWIGRT